MINSTLFLTGKEAPVLNSNIKAPPRQSAFSLNPSNPAIEAFEKQKLSQDESLKELLSSPAEGVLSSPQQSFVETSRSLFQARNLLQSGDNEKETAELEKEAKEEKVKAIFTQPEFSDTTAKIIAKELQIPVVKVSPLAANWSENLINIAKVIAGNN